MRKFYLKRYGISVTIPTKQDIDNLKIGDRAPTCFDYDGIVKEIIYRGIDINGKAYIGYYAEWSLTDSRISMSLKENELVIPVKLCGMFTANKLKQIESDLLRSQMVTSK